MKADVFLDSNVLLHAAANVQTEAEKKAAALRLIAETDFGTSVQVLGEFFDNARRKARLCIPERTMREILTLLRTRPLVEETVKLFDHSVALAERYQVRYYDAAILAAAMELGCKTLFTEDLADGRNYSGVSVVNPFRSR